MAALQFPCFKNSNVFFVTGLFSTMVRKCEYSMWTIDACGKTKPTYSAPRQWGPNGLIAIQEGVTCSCPRGMCNSQTWDTIFNASTVEIARRTRDFVTHRSLGDTSTVNRDIAAKKNNAVNLIATWDMSIPRITGDTSTVTVYSTHGVPVTDSDDNGSRSAKNSANFIPIQIIIIIINCGNLLWECLRTQLF